MRRIALFASVFVLVAARAVRAGQAQRGRHDRGSRVDRPRGRRRPHHRRIDRPRLSGSALRRGQAELHPEAAARRPADRRRPRAGDRLAAAAVHAEPQRRIQAGAPGYLDASLGATILEIPTGQITRAMGDVHPLGNPHYWLDPENGKRIAKQIADKLSELRPNDRAYFQQQLADFTARLDAAEKRWLAMMAPYKGTKVVTYHRSFPNFAERFGLDIIGYVEPRPGIPPTPQHTLDLINEMKRQNVKLVLVEPYFDLKTPNAIGRETGARGAGDAAVGRRHQGGHRLLQAVRLRHQPAGERDQEDGDEIARGRYLDAGVPGRAVRGQPDPHRHSRLSRRARRRAGRDLRRSVAGADRRARRDHRAADAVVERRSARRRTSTGSACCSPSSARWCSRRFAAIARGFRRRRSSASATPWRRRRRFWR